jgi:hypothetical protein
VVEECLQRNLRPPPPPRCRCATSSPTAIHPETVVTRRQGRRAISAHRPFAYVTLGLHPRGGRRRPRLRARQCGPPSDSLGQLVTDDKRASLTDPPGRRWAHDGDPEGRFGRMYGDCSRPLTQRRADARQGSVGPATTANGPFVGRDSAAWSRRTEGAGFHYHSSCLNPSGDRRFEGVLRWFNGGHPQPMRGQAQHRSGGRISRDFGRASFDSS